MMKAFKRTISLLLVFIMVATLLPLSLMAAATGTVEIENDYIKVVVNKSNGRFAIRTVDGQPIRKNDQNSNLTFTEDDTSFTTFVINGTEYIFGNKYKIDSKSVQSDITEPEITVDDKGNQSVSTTWSVENVYITQIITLANMTDVKNTGNAVVEYNVVNRSGASVKVKTRVLLDVMAGTNDGPAYQNGTTSENLQTTERTLIRGATEVFENGKTYVDGVEITDANRSAYKEATANKTESGYIIKVGGVEVTDVNRKSIGKYYVSGKYIVDGYVVEAANKNYFDLGAYWVVRDTVDVNSPLATNIFGYGFNNISAGAEDAVDRVVVGHWNHMANSKFDIDVDRNLDFTADTNDYGTADSAVAFFWDEDTIANGGTRSYMTTYGLGEIVNPTGAFSIQFMDQVSQLDTNDAQTAYVRDGVFRITVQVENLSDLYHDSATVKLTLDNGLDFVETDNGKIIYDTATGLPKKTSDGRSQTYTHTKTKTIEDMENIENEVPGYENIGKIAPGETFAKTFYVMASGKPWPTTKEYMVEVSSPQIEAAVKEGTDESIKSLYKCTRSDFVFLPAVGAAQPTYAYAMSPEECFYKDEKIINVNLSNIEAYNLGTKNQNGAYVKNTENFSVYLVNCATNDRYKVPVQSSALLINSGDGSTGDMRITYRGGVMVDENDNVIDPSMQNDPTLPVGEYRVEIKFDASKMSSLTEDEQELYNELFSLETEQSFLTSTNEESRIREAGLLAIVKSSQVLSPANFLTYVAAVEGMVGAATALDPTYEDPYEIEDKNSNEVPYYEALLVEDEDALAELEEELGEDGELVLLIEGMVKEQDGNIFVDTSTEPAIINGCVTYEGTDLAVTQTDGMSALLGTTLLNLLPSAVKSGLDSIKFDPDAEEGLGGFGLLSVNGDGTLAISSSGFVFHSGEWSVDFYQGFDKTLSPEDEEEEDEGDEEEEEDDDKKDEDEDDENPMLDWAVGNLSDQLNPLKTITVGEIYFNRKSLFSVPSFSVAGFGLKFTEFKLSREEDDFMVSFGGGIEMYIVEADVQNVYFDGSGFYGIESQLKFNLDAAIGLLGEAEEGKNSGTITINHFRNGVAKTSEYGIAFAASIKDTIGIECELSFKKVEDGRILPDVIAFGAEIPDPGLVVVPGVSITSIKGGLRELADTIAGTGGGSVPLTVEAGVGASFGVAPANFDGEINMTLKMTGVKFEGEMKFQKMEMLTEALIEAQWCTPWFIHAKAEVDILGWDVIVGKAELFIGENQELNRTDFSGMVSAALQLPGWVPIVGGMALRKMTFEFNNDMIGGTVGIGVGPICIPVGVTYYFSGDIEFNLLSEDGVPDDDALIYLERVDSASGETQLIGIGQGIRVVASSDPAMLDSENEIQDMGEGVRLMSVGSDTVELMAVNDLGTSHSIPVNDIYSAARPAEALIMVEYFDELPKLTLRDGNGAEKKLELCEAGDYTQGGTKTPGTVYYYLQDQDVDGATVRYAHIVVPFEDLTSGGADWTLESDATVETTLLSIPRAAELRNVTLSSASSDSITATAEVEYVQPGDVVEFYLASEPESEGTETITGADGEQIAVPKTSDPGLKIFSYTIQAGDISSPTGKFNAATITQKINLSACEVLGETLNVNEHLESGKYYLRASLKSGVTYRTSVDNGSTVTLSDPKAPNALGGEPTLTYAGNGYFDLTFPASAQKDGQGAMALGYAVDFCNPDGTLYEGLNGLYYTAEELGAPNNGNYTIRLGGYQATENGFTGLETGKSYIARVRAANTDADGNYHFAAPKNSGSTSLPVYAPPMLSNISIGGVSAVYGVDGQKAYSALVNSVSPTLKATVPANASVEVVCGGDSYGVLGANGELPLTAFATDGEYCIELHAVNTSGANKGDTSVTVVYLTIDTIAPFLYLTSPTTGDRSENGAITVSGMTTGGGDTTLTVYVDGASTGTAIAVDSEGGFSGSVGINTASPTASLRFVVKDAAGNLNSATVDVTNDDYRIPQSIVLREEGTLALGETRNLQASVRYADGRDGDGNVVYTEEVIGNDKLEYETYSGSAISVSANGAVRALSSGATIVRAVYTSESGAEFETMLALRAASGIVPPEGGGGTGGSGGTGGDGGGGSGGSGGSGGAGEGEPGGETGTDIPAEDAMTRVGDTPVGGTAADGILKIEVDAPRNTGDLEVVSEKTGFDGYEFAVTPETAKNLSEKGGDLSIETPLGTVNVPNGDVTPDGFTVSIRKNGAADVSAAGKAAAAVGAKLAGSGEGVTVTVTGAVLDASSGAKALIAIPEAVRLNEFTAVIIVDGKGNWTPVTWKLNMVGSKAYVELAALAEGSVVFMTVEDGFTDIPEGYWAESEIDAAAKKMFVTGVGGGIFDYASDVTRAQFATALLRAGGLMLTDTGGVTLSDVSSTHWSWRPMAVAVKVGLMEGYEDGSIKGEERIPRIQAMALTGRLIKLLGVSGDMTQTEIEELLGKFSDYEKLPDWAAEDVALCVKYGVIKGTGDKLDLTSYLTRAQSAAIGNRVDQLLIQELLR